jgi:hypothetical protein
MIRILLETNVNSKNLHEIQEAAEVEFDELHEMISGNYKMMEHEKLEKLIKELNDNITDINYEKELFNKINNIINIAKIIRTASKMYWQMA